MLLRALSGQVDLFGRSTIGSRRIVQVLLRNLVSRAWFQWWHAILLVYILLLWRSVRKATGDLKGLSWQKLVLAIHIGLVNYLANKAVRVAIFFQTFTAAPKYVASSLQELAKARVEKFLDTQMDSLGEKTKNLIKDPYMPFPIQDTVDDFVDVFLPHLKLALFTKTDEMLDGYRYRKRLAMEQNEYKLNPSVWVSSSSHRRSNSVKFEASSCENDRKARRVKSTANGQDDIDSVLDALEDDEKSLSEDSVSVEDAEEDTVYLRDLRTRTKSWMGRIFSVNKPIKEVSQSLPETKLPSESDDAEKLVRVKSLVLRTWPGSLIVQTTLRVLEIRSLIRHRFSLVRSHILYTLSPFDRTFWRCIRDPEYWILNFVGLVPGVGMVWWLFMFILHDKRDEYQLSQFLVGFQTAKFFSHGCFNLMRGAFLYYICAMREIPNCDVDGPMMGDTSQVLFFLIQIVIVWLIFFMLPQSEPCCAVNDPVHAFLLDENRQDRSQAALRAKLRLGRGGRLMKLFWWDTLAVCLILMIFAFAFFILGQREWKLKMTCYFLGVVYGLSSLPFVPFKIPLMGQLLVPAKATGYTRKGETVLRVIAPPPKSVLHSRTLDRTNRNLLEINRSKGTKIGNPEGKDVESGAKRLEVKFFSPKKAPAGDGAEISSANIIDADDVATYLYEKSWFFLADSFEMNAFRAEQELMERKRESQREAQQSRFAYLRRRRR